MHSKFLLAAAATLALSATGAQAADWSDTSLGVRYGTSFAEPYNNTNGASTDIAKTIVNLTHVSGYKYGSFFINADFLMSDKKDPVNGVVGNAGAQEVYAVLRHTLDIGKVSGANFKFGPMRGLGLTAGLDVNTKNDGYGSKKRMFVVGPTVMFDVPGYLNLSALLLDESNSPNSMTSRYHYRNHGALQADWGIAIGALPLSFNGYAMYIGSKGKNEFGGDTAPETHVDMNLMLDVGAVTGTAKKTLLVGVAYEFWKNKFGNAAYGNAGSGAFAHTPMIRAEYHF